MHDLDLEAKLVTGDDRPTEPAAVDTEQVDQFLGTILDVREQEDASCLGERLDDQDAGHHRGAGEMPLEEFLVDRDILDRDDLLPRLFSCEESRSTIGELLAP